MIETSEQKVIGPEGSYILNIIAIFAEVLWAGNNLATEETNGRIINLLKNCSLLSCPKHLQHYLYHIKTCCAPSCPPYNLFVHSLNVYRTEIANRKNIRLILAD